MNCPDDTSSAGRGLWCYPDDDAAAEDDHHLTSMFSDYHSNDDLFELVWQQGGGGGGGDVMMEQPVHDPEVLLPNAPSEDEMASWLSAIVKGQEHASDGAGNGSGWRMPMEKESTVTEGMDTNDTAGDSGKKAAAGGARRSHHGETHNLTEKKRRYKINERLKTLQQLVPGLDKQSNHASTLEQTIQYMKWLQHQVQAMSATPPPVRTPAATTTAVFPAGVAPVVLGPLPMVQFRPLLPCAAHYPASAVLVPAAAAAPPLYPAPGTATVTTVTAANQRHGSSNSMLKGSSSSVRHKA